MRLKLTLEYDGTGFRGWAAQPGLRTVEGALRDALATVFYVGVAGSSVAGRTDTGVHALANVVSVDVEGGPAAGARGGRARTRRCPTTSRSSQRRRSQPTSSAPLRRAFAVATATASGDGASARRSSIVARCGTRDRSTTSVSPTRPTLLVGQHDFRAFTPTETQHTVFVRNVERARVASTAATRSSSRSRPTRSCATWCARSSARCSSGRRSELRRSSKAATASEAGPTARRGGSTSNASTYLSVARGYHRRHALSGRSLRSRRHRRRLRRDHPRLDATRHARRCSAREFPTRS